MVYYRCYWTFLVGLTAVCFGQTIGGRGISLVDKLAVQFNKGTLKKLVDIDKITDKIV